MANKRVLRQKKVNKIQSQQRQLHCLLPMSDRNIDIESKLELGTIQFKP